MSGWGKADDKTSTGTVALAAPTSTFNGASNVDSNIITVAAHPFRNGDRVNYIDGGGTQVVGLVDTTNYFITNATTNTVQLASSQEDALRNVPAVITLADGAGAAHKLTLAFAPGTRGLITGASSADFEGAGQEAFVGDIITVLTQQMLILSIESATKCTVMNLDRSVALAAFSAAQYTLNEKPLSIGSDANVSSSDVYGIDSAEMVGGADNVVASSISNAGTSYLEAPAVTVTAPAGLVVATSAVSIAADTITITGHNLNTGDKLTYTHQGGTALAGLANATAYFVIKVDANTIQVASSLSNANAGTKITLTGTGNNAQKFTGDTAAVTASVAGGVVSALTITDVGSGYTAALPTMSMPIARRTIPLASVADGVTDTITYTAHSLDTAAEVKYQDGGGTALAGLVDNTSYFVSALGAGADKFRLATSAVIAAGSNLGTVVIGGTGGQFTCAAATLAAGDRIQISGTLGGTGAIAGYATGTVYKVSAVTGSSPNVTGFTLETEADQAIVTTAGTPTGLTYLAATVINFTGQGNNAQFFELIGETTATGVFSRGIGGAEDGAGGVAHSGWVKRTVGTGARAGRIQYEVLVALSKNGITSDAADDIQIPD